jgi:prepilin-type N-terminal cleavage/methylation domain-containing protein
MVRTKKQWLGKVRVWFQDQRGLSLPESIVAVSIVGMAVVAFVTALSAGSIAVREGGQEVVAQRLARNQLEYIKSCPYATTYSTVEAPEGYTISVVVGATPDNDSDIQKIRVTIQKNANNILTVEDYKVNR